VSTTASNLPQELMTKYARLFNDPKTIKFLPVHRLSDCKINLKPNASIPFQSIYLLSYQETQTLKEYLDASFALGHIVPSKLPAGSPIFFVKKKNGEL
jgi:hypothetical protein